MDSDTVFRYFPVSKRDRDWGCYALTAGMAGIPPHAPYPLQGHPRGHHFAWEQGRILPEFALLYIAGGRGIFESAGCRLRPVDSGSVLLLFPGVWHRYRPDPEIGWTEFWIGFDGAQPRELLRRRFFSAKRPIIRPSDEPGISSIFRSLVLSIREDSPALQQVMAGSTMHLLGMLFSASQKRCSAVKRRNDGGVASALDCMRGGVCPPNALPCRLGISTRKFRRDFQQHTGMSPHQYHLQLRLAEARQMLSDPGLSVKEVAAACGFGDEQYFCRLFKKKTGMTTSQWRRTRKVASAPSARRRT